MVIGDSPVLQRRMMQAARGLVSGRALSSLMPMCTAGQSFIIYNPKSFVVHGQQRKFSISTKPGTETEEDDENTYGGGRVKGVDVGDSEPPRFGRKRNYDLEETEEEYPDITVDSQEDNVVDEELKFDLMRNREQRRELASKVFQPEINHGPQSRNCTFMRCTRKNERPAIPNPNPSKIYTILVINGG